MSEYHVISMRVSLFTQVEIPCNNFIHIYVRKDSLYFTGIDSIEVNPLCTESDRLSHFPSDFFTCLPIIIEKLAPESRVES